MKISEVAITEKIITGTANFMFTFIIEGHTKFQLEFSKTKDLIFTSTSL